MSEFLKGISPSLRSSVCYYVFDVMLNKNDIIKTYISCIDQVEKDQFISMVLKRLEIEFVPPEQIIIT